MPSTLAASQGPLVPARTSSTAAAIRLASALASSERDEPAAVSAADSEAVSGVGSPFVGSDSTSGFVGSTLMPHLLPRTATAPAHAATGRRAATYRETAVPPDRGFPWRRCPWDR